MIYSRLIERKCQSPTNSQTEWGLDCNLLNNDSFDWKPTYLMAKRSTKSTKFKEFQFKLLHRRLPTNTFLHRIGTKENESCTFCHESQETLIHLFWACPVTALFWEHLTKWLERVKLIQETHTLIDITALCLRPDSSKFSIQLNYCVLLVRYHIWQAKLNEVAPNRENFLRLIKTRFTIETKGGDIKKMGTSYRLHVECLFHLPLAV